MLLAGVYPASASLPEVGDSDRVPNTEYVIPPVRELRRARSRLLRMVVSVTYPRPAEGIVRYALEDDLFVTVWCRPVGPPESGPQAANERTSDQIRDFIEPRQG